MDDNNTVEDNGDTNKALAVIVSILAFFEVGFLIVLAQFIFAPEMSFSENGFVRLIGLLFCYFVASRFYSYLTDGNDRKKAMIIFTIIFIITVLVIFII